jgi:hypothetical protein
MPPSSAPNYDAQVASLQAGQQKLESAIAAIGAKLDHHVAQIADDRAEDRLQILTKLTEIETGLRVRQEERLARQEARRQARDDRGQRDTE